MEPVSSTTAIPRSRTPRPHWLVFAIAVGWVVVLTWYWWRWVPLEPVRTFQVDEGMVFAGLSPEGEMMFSHQRGLRRADGGYLCFGPLEFRSLPDGKTVRRAFTEADLVAPFSDGAIGQTIIIRDGAVHLATLSGEVLDELPGIQWPSIPHCELKGNRLVWQDEQGVVLYDMEAKRVLTRLANESGRTWRLHSVQAGEAIAMRNERQKGTEQGFWRLIDLESGSIDERFEKLSLNHVVQVSPDQRLVAAYNDKTLTIFDRQSATKLWSADFTALNFTIRFENHGRVLAVDRLDPSGTLRASRWQAADGTPIIILPVDEQGSGFRSVIEGTQFAIDFTWRQKPDWEQSLGRKMQQWSYQLGGSYLWKSEEQRSTLVDLDRDRALGSLPIGWMTTYAMPGGTGMVTWADNSDHEVLRYYRLPPGRSWRWLVQSAFGPAGLLVGFAWIRARRRAG